MDFEFYAGGIEDAMLSLLETAMKPIGVRSFETYSGQLDNKTLKEALAAKAMTFPLVMVSYADGVTEQMPGTAPVMNRPIHYRHDCTFVVVVASNDARGEKGRRRGALVKGQTTGAYQMMAKVWDTLAGLRLFAMVEGEKVLLTTDVLSPTANEFITNMPNITAYAVIFQTAFKWSSPDRTAATVDVTELNVGTSSIGVGSVAEQLNGPPGVSATTGD